MTREELKTATNEELIDKLDYCGYDSYYDKYRADIVAEIKKRMKEPILDKIIAEIIELRRSQNVGVLECLDIIYKYKAESEKEK